MAGSLVIKDVFEDLIISVKEAAYEIWDKIEIEIQNALLFHISL